MAVLVWARRSRSPRRPPAVRVTSPSPVRAPPLRTAAACVAGARYGALNAAPAREARRRRNLHVFQWARLACANRHWFGPDRVHPSGVGYRARARGIAKVVRRCR